MNIKQFTATNLQYKNSVITINLLINYMLYMYIYHKHVYAHYKKTSLWLTIFAFFKYSIYYY